MKNNYLKKAGAVALAAVMAVTFAPVASLDAFAANSNVGAGSNNTVITASGVIIEENGTYVVSSEGVAIDATISGGATKVTFKLKGQTDTTKEFTVKGNANTSKDAVITVDGSWISKSAAAGDVVDQAVIDSSLKTFGAVKFTGTMKVTNNSTQLNSKLASAFGTTPVATTDATLDGSSDTFIIGADAINTAASYKAPLFDSKYNDLYALNGAVDVKALKDGHFLKISPSANAGTTVTAKAEDDKSLVKVTTKYAYNFTSSDLNAGQTVGLGSYTDVMFAAGKNGISTLSLTTAPSKDDAINTKTLAVSGVTPIAVKQYDRAIDLTENAKDTFDVGMVVPYTDAFNYTSGNKPTDYSGSFGITYFTKDPTKYASATDGVAVIDGSKYVIDSTSVAKATKTVGTTTDSYGQLEVASLSAGKTLQVLRGTSASGLAVDAMNTLHSGKDVTVSAPTSASVVIGHIETVGTKYSNWVNKGYVYGANHVEGINKGVGFLGSESAEYGNSVVSSQLDVPQVAAGTYAVVHDAFADTVVKTGKDVTYFYEQKTTQVGVNGADFVFGSTTTATGALKNVLSGTPVNGTNYFTQAKPGETVYVAKDIKGAFSNVNPNVKVVGEISQESKKDTDGTYTWTVNQGTALTGASAIPAYRMYRKTGEHVYTINPAEVSMLVNAGWINEGVAFKVNSVASKTGTPVYRVYNRNNGGMHFYTANAAEKDMLLQNGWTEGAVVFYGAEKATGIPVYRTYNTGSNNGEHNYTTNIKESDMNVKAGWRAEGVAFYVFK